MSTKGSRILTFVLSTLLCLAAGGIGSFFTFQAIPTWYASLNKPFFSPPNWIFGPVWTTLYIMMGIALGMVWQFKKSKMRSLALLIFGLQLFLNVFWSFAFFGLKNPLFGLIVVVTLWLSIFKTIQVFKATSKPAASLLLPYLIWVSFASILNLAIFLLN